jgi:formylglycine-generating enzyme required for sulfatase activity
MTGRIFISYRRVDSQYATDQIYDLLVRHFGVGTVFMDIDAIPLGVNFRDYIDQQVSTSDIVLAVIGDIWLTVTAPDGQVRLHDPNDFVRLEIEAALKQGIKLIPLYIGGVEALPAGQLPDSLQELSMLNAIRIRRSTDFVPDVEKLIRGLDNIRAEQEATRAKNRAALEVVAAALPVFTENLTSLKDLSIEERRQRKALQDTAEDLVVQVSVLLAEPARCLRVDLMDIKRRLDQLEDDLFTLRLKADQRRQDEAQRAEITAAQTAGQQAEETRLAAQRAANQARLLSVSGMITEILDEVGKVSDLNAKERRAQASIKRSGEIALRSLQRVLASTEELLHADVRLFQDRLDSLHKEYIDLTADIEERRAAAAAAEEQRRLKKAAAQSAAEEKAETDRIAREQAAAERIVRQREKAESPEPVVPKDDGRPKPSPAAGRTLQSVPVWAWGGGAIVLIALVFGLSRLLGGGLALSRAEETATPTITVSPTKSMMPTETPVLTSTPETYVTPTPAPTAAPIDTKINPVDGASMAYIPAGEFQMGSDDPTMNASPVHTVYTDSFWMYRTEVTNAMFVSFLQAGNDPEIFNLDLDNVEGNPPIRQVGGEWKVAEEKKNHPVSFLSWNDARAYCEWAGGRLPTEAEWEKAARGGLEGKLYPWGDEVPIDMKNIPNGAFFTSAQFYGDYVLPQVGQYLPNGYGLYDMAGSVGEWVNSCYLEFPYTANDNRESPDNCEGNQRVIRGGNLQKSGAQVSFRFGSSDGTTFIAFGFRCVMDAP